MKKIWMTGLSFGFLMGTIPQVAYSAPYQTYPQNYTPQYLNYRVSAHQHSYYTHNHYYTGPHSHPHPYTGPQSNRSNQDAALVAYRSKNYGRAAVLMKKAVVSHPDDASLLTKYAYVLMKLDRYQEALKVLEQVASSSKLDKYTSYANRFIPELKKTIAGNKSKGTDSVSTDSLPGLTTHEKNKPPTEVGGNAKPVEPKNSAPVSKQPDSK